MIGASRQCEKDASKRIGCAKECFPYAMDSLTSMLNGECLCDHKVKLYRPGDNEQP